MFNIYITLFMLLLGNATANYAKENNLVGENIFKHNYYDNLLNNLEQEQWAPDEMICKHKIINVIDNVQNFTLWAVWIWDSMSTNPVGNMMGSALHLGNFDQCLMKTPWTQMETKYCLTDVKLHNNKFTEHDEIYSRHIRTFDPFERADKIIHTTARIQINMNDIKWGVCLPIECSEKSVERYTRALLKSSYFGLMEPTTSINTSVVICQTEKYPTLFKITTFVIVGGILLIITLISSNYIKTNNTDTTLWHKIAKSFSFSDNCSQLMKSKSKDDLNSMYGIKFLLSSNTMLMHVILFSYPIFSNTLEFDQKLITVLAILRSDLAVDGFFCLSGLLLMKSLMSKSPKNVTDLFIHALRRYVRLVPLLMVIIIYQSALAEIGHGPFLKKITSDEINYCYKNWWTILLMIANIYDTPNMCLPIAWSVSCDFQLFLCTIVLFYLYKKGYIGNITLSIIGLTAIVIPGFMSHSYGFRVIPAFAMRNVKNIRQDSYVFHLYFPTYTRAGAYIVGLIAGYFISLYKLPDFKGLLNKRQSIIGLTLSLGLIAFVHLRGDVYSEEHGVIEEFLFTCLHRPLLAAGMATFIICCTYGDVPILPRILGHRYFFIFNKLSYGVNMLHVYIIARVTMITRSTIVADEFVFIVITIGIMVVTCIKSLFFFLLVEAPIPKLVEQFVIPLLKGNTVDEFNKNNHINEKVLSKDE